MKLIIEIPEEVYKTVQDGSYCGSLYEELKAAIPYNPSGDSISRKWVKNNVLSLIDPETRYYVKQKIDSAPSVCGNNPNWCESCVSKGKCASTNLKGGKEE